MSRRSTLSTLTLTLAALAGASSLYAIPIITTVGTPDFYSSINSSITNAGSWTFTTTWTNVSIAASLSSSAVGGHTGTAYLTNQIGPGTTIANQIATSTFNFPASTFTHAYGTLFSGLTLGPGTYYLVVSSANPGGFVGVFSASPALSSTGFATYITASGVTVGPGLSTQFGVNDSGYAPASTFAETNLDYLLTVTGDAAVPEPSAAVLLGCGLLGLVGCRLRRR